MEHYNQYDGLLTQYLLQELTEDDRRTVEEWINASEENTHYFESLRITWNLSGVRPGLETIDPGNEWISLYQKLYPPASPAFEPDHAADALSAKRAKRNRIIISTTIAALVLLLIGFGWNWFRQSQKAAEKLTKHEPPKVGAINAIARIEVNYDKTEKKIVLVDGSQVTLGANSECRFTEPFLATSREIYLKGQAHFKVAKDEKRPFTVFSADISTTALSTEFNVDANDEAKTISVEVFEGKLVVKPVQGSFAKQKKEVILHAGEQLVYNKKSLEVLVRKFRLKR